jgi:PAS domain S-box-containing protein
MGPQPQGNDRTPMRRGGLHRQPLLLMIGVIIVLFVLVYALRASDTKTKDDVLLLFVIPVVIAAIRFGVVGGLIAGVCAIGVMMGYYEIGVDADIDPLGYIARASVFLPLGGVLGWFSANRSALLRRLATAEQISLDMTATLAADGYFKSLNPAWEHTLGYSTDELLGRPFVDFVHPDDRERSVAEAARVADGHDAISFRNRYRAADGSYRWLEWNATFSANDSLIYCVARDVTIQHQAEQLVRQETAMLESTVQERTVALQDARLENLHRLALAAEYRDDDTHQHTERVGRAAQLIARRLDLDDNFVWAINLAAPLHDVGKIGVPDHILLKPGRLTDDEFELMKTHTLIGAAILGDSNSELLRLGEEIALTHHERWGGGGYPTGVAGEEIPIAGRIVAVADAFDAMTNPRPYRPALPRGEAIAELIRCAGTQFDPEVVSAYLDVLGVDEAQRARVNTGNERSPSAFTA